MDEEIGKLGENYEAVSDQLERLQNGRYGYSLDHPDLSSLDT